MSKKHDARKISRTECVPVENQDSLLIHVILEMRPPPKKSGRRAKSMSGRAYQLIIRQADHDLLDIKFPAATKFPLAGMKDMLSGSIHEVIKKNMDAIGKALKEIRTQLEKAEREANDNGGG